MSCEELAALAEEHWDGVMERSPITATLFGDHRFDDRVDDVSPEGLAERRSFAEQTCARAEAIDPATLSRAERVTRALLLAECGQIVEQIDAGDIRLSTDPYGGMPMSLLRVATQVRVPDAASADALLTRLRRLPATLDALIDQWETGAAAGWSSPRASAGRSAAMVEAYLSGPVEGDPFVNPVLPEGWDGAERWRSEAAAIVRDHLRPAYERVGATLAALVRDGRGDDRPGLCHVPGGDELYRSRVARSTTTDLDPEEIHEFGVHVLTEVLPEEWAEIGGRAVGVTDRAELFAHLAGDPAMKYASADDILDLARDAIDRALAAAPAWFDALPTSDVVVAPVPDDLAPGLPPAYYLPPAGEGSRPGTYFANTHQATRRNRFEGECICFHEAVPGHHLERALAAENTDVPTFQQRSSYTAYTEGWGLYTERLADEMELYSSDVMRLGMLSADAWRSVRLVVDTGMHALGWSRTAALDFMVTHTPLDPAEAAVEIDRYIGTGAQALAYKIGQREVFRLRDDAEARLGPRFDIRGFHTTVLEHGGVPLGLLAELVDDWVTRTLPVPSP